MLITLLPRKLAASRWRRLWLAILLSAPLAYTLGALLYIQFNPNAHVRFALDRSSAFGAGINFLSGKGLSVGEWERYCIVETKDNEQFYFDAAGQAERAQVKTFAPATRIKVFFRKPDSTEGVEVQFAPSGQPISFRRRFWQPDTELNQEVAAAQALAEKALRARPEAAAFQFAAQPTLRTAEGRPEATRSAATRSFTWQWTLPTLPELKAHTTISIRNNQVIGEEVETELDAAFVRAQLRQDQGIKIFSQVAFWLVLIVTLSFGVYRFIKRARQKEISYLRIFLITGFVALVLNLFVMLSDGALYQVAATSRDAVPAWLIYLSSGMFWVLVALFLGLAYGSGEGDIREAYPGKLTSIDALILGKLHSRNIGRAVVWGFALGGWVWLVIQLGWALWARQPYSGEGILPFTIYFAELPILLVLTSWQTDVALVVVVGLLLPLPFLRRRLRPESRLGRWTLKLADYLPQRWTENWTERCVIAVLAVFAWVACQEPQLNFRPWTGILLMAAIRAFVLLFTFFTFDLLTAAVAMALPLYCKFALVALLQPATEFRQTGLLALGFALAVFLVELYFALRGRWFEDEEVRPIYAKNLAERLSLQAEVSAARVAQERLLPQSLPLTPSYTVAASCLPAREVGGDFYDFFEMGSQQLGLLVAEGGGRGLGSALTIAYAKGFLMPKLSGQSSNADASPTEVLRGLQEKLTQMLMRDDAVGLSFATLDTDDGVLRYARVGDYPQILLGRAGQPPRLEKAEEVEIKFTLRGNTLTPSEPLVIIEGRAELAPGDLIIIYTGGLVDAWQTNKQIPEREWEQLVAQATQASTSEEFQAALLHSVNQTFKRVRQQELDDDLTAVVIRVEQVAALAEPAHA